MQINNTTHSGFSPSDLLLACGPATLFLGDVASLALFCQGLNISFMAIHSIIQEYMYILQEKVHVQGSAELQL